MMKAISEVRPSPIAGAWYTDDPHRLAQQIDGYLTGARLPDITGEVIGLIAPHAGHRYSGRTAGHAFATVMGRSVDLVAVLSPMHAPYPADLLTTAHRAYGTPLGKVPVDLQAVDHLEALLRPSGLRLTRIANDQEHSLEIELPFLQRALQEPFQLLPVMIRSQSPEVVRELGMALAQVMRARNSLLVASTDLSHFYSEELAYRLDQEMLGQMLRFSPEGVLETEHTGRGFACGAPAVASMLWAAQSLGANTVTLLHYSTSGDVSGDRTSVVGYGAAAVLRSTAFETEGPA